MSGAYASKIEEMHPKSLAVQRKLEAYVVLVVCRKLLGFL